MVAFLYTDWATLLGMVYSLSAFAIFTLYLSISNIDRSLILAAYDAGAGKLARPLGNHLAACASPASGPAAY